MKKIINYFELRAPYHFEWNDVFGFLNCVNAVLVIKFGLVASWFGLAIALACMVDDVIEVKRLNLFFLHFSILILNIHFLLMYYCA